MRIAIIGTRNPSYKQLEYVKAFINSLNKGDTIISGCAKGIDAVALASASERGIKTIGYVPFAGYEKGIQKSCTEVKVLASVSDELKKGAYASVKLYHPTGKMSKAAFAFHARNFLIVRDADIVIALPSKHAGGTRQGIRIAKALGIQLRIIDQDGNEIEDEYAETY